jgi:DNA (cytosine-5)-methyltransferase 1
MNHLSLFSGIGGLDLAAEWAGFRTIGFVERDKFCQRVLAKHWPSVPIWDDVAEVTADACSDRFIRGAEQDQRQEQPEQQTPRRNDAGRLAAPRVGVDIISGGFPCQPHSVAGLRKGSADERDLWAECARIVGEFRPRWCVFENVPGLLTSERGTFFARVLGDLAALGYRVGWCVYGAVDVGAPHRRDRVFIVAVDRNAERGSGTRERAFGTLQERTFADPDGVRQAMADAECRGLQRRSRGELLGERRASIVTPNGSKTGRAWESNSTGECWQSEPDVGRVAHGIPRRVDRLRALGNAVVPQQAYPIFRAIAELEGIRHG